MPAKNDACGGPSILTPSISASPVSGLINDISRSTSTSASADLTSTDTDIDSATVTRYDGISCKCACYSLARRGHWQPWSCNSAKGGAGIRALVDASSRIVACKGFLRRGSHAAIHIKNNHEEHQGCGNALVRNGMPSMLARHGADVGCHVAYLGPDP